MYNVLSYRAVISVIMIFTTSIVEAVLLWSMHPAFNNLQFYCKATRRWTNIICPRLGPKLFNSHAYVLVIKKIASKAIISFLMFFVTSTSLDILLFMRKYA